MSALPPAEHPNNNGQPSDANKSDSADQSSTQPEVAEMDTTPDQPPEETWDDIPEEIMELDTGDILTRIRLIDNDIKVSFPVCCGFSEIILRLGDAFRAVAVRPRAERHEREN